MHLFDPFPKQEEYLESILSGHYSFILYGGAIRGGKTFALLGMFILLSRIYPGSKWVVIRKDLPRIKRNVLPVFWQVCPVAFIREKPSQYNEWTCTFVNGSQLLFFAENIDKDPDLDRFKGLEFDGCGFEEMDVSEETFNKAFERMGSWKMGERKAAKESGQPVPPSFVTGTCNPSQGWVKKRIYDKWKMNNLPDKWKYIPSKVFDNPHVPQEWIDDKKMNMTPLNYQRFVQGDWEVNLNEHPFFYEFDHDKHVKPTQLQPFEPIWLSFDFNIEPTTCIVGQKITGQGLYVHKVYQVNGGTRSLCDHLQHYKDYILRVTGDFSGNTGSTAAGILPGGQFNTDYKIILQQLELSQNSLIDTLSANKLHTYSRSLCNTVFFRCPISIHPDCEALINDLMTAQPNNRGGLLKDRNEHKQDAGDAFRYLVNAWFLDGMEGVNKFTQLIIQ